MLLAVAHYLPPSAVLFYKLIEIGLIFKWRRNYFSFITQILVQCKVVILLSICPFEESYKRHLCFTQVSEQYACIHSSSPLIYDKCLARRVICKHFIFIGAGSGS